MLSHVNDVAETVMHITFSSKTFLSLTCCYVCGGTKGVKLSCQRWHDSARGTNITAILRSNVSRVRIFARRWAPATSATISAQVRAAFCSSA